MFYRNDILERHFENAWNNLTEKKYLIGIQARRLSRVTNHLNHQKISWLAYHFMLNSHITFNMHVLSRTRIDWVSNGDCDNIQGKTEPCCKQTISMDRDFLATEFYVSCFACDVIVNSTEWGSPLENIKAIDKSF